MPDKYKVTQVPIVFPVADSKSGEVVPGFQWRVTRVETGAHVGDPYATEAQALHECTKLNDCHP